MTLTPMSLSLNNHSLLHQVCSEGFDVFRLLFTLLLFSPLSLSTIRKIIIVKLNDIQFSYFVLPHVD